MITEANQVGPPKVLSGKGDTAVCKEVKPQIRRGGALLADEVTVDWPRA